MKLKNKINFTVLILNILFLFKGYPETIHTKDGRKIAAENIKVEEGVVWYDVTSGKAGLNIEDIERITNNDGTISRFFPDYKEETIVTNDPVKQAQSKDIIESEPENEIYEDENQVNQKKPRQE